MLSMILYTRIIKGRTIPFFFLTSLSSLLIPKRPDSNFNQPRVTFAMFPLRIVRASVVASGAHNLLPLENEGLAPKNL